jgi:hypothetical protein
LANGAKNFDLAKSSFFSNTLALGLMPIIKSVFFVSRAIACVERPPRSSSF